MTGCAHGADEAYLGPAIDVLYRSCAHGVSKTDPMSNLLSGQITENLCPLIYNKRGTEENSAKLQV